MGIKNRPLATRSGILTAKRASHTPRKEVRLRIDNKSLRQEQNGTDIIRPEQVYVEPEKEVPEAEDSQSETLVVESRIQDPVESDEAELRQLHSGDRKHDLPPEELGEQDSSEPVDNSYARVDPPPSIQKTDISADDDNLSTPPPPRRTRSRKGSTRKTSSRSRSKSEDKVSRKVRKTKKE